MAHNRLLAHGAIKPSKKKNIKHWEPFYPKKDLVGNDPLHIPVGGTQKRKKTGYSALERELVWGLGIVWAIDHITDPSNGSVS